MRKMTAGAWYEQLLRVEGRRLVLLAAADYLESHHVTTDIGPVEKPLRSRELGDVLIPERLVFEVIRDLQKWAGDLALERASMQQVEILVPDLPEAARSEAADRRKAAASEAGTVRELKLVC